MQAGEPTTSWFSFDLIGDEVVAVIEHFVVSFSIGGLR